MPNASELERKDQEAEPPVLSSDSSGMSFWRLVSWRWRSRHCRLKERIAIWIAWRLPKRIALWAMIRVAAHATTGRWGHEHPGNLTYKDMHDRWGIDNG